MPNTPSSSSDINTVHPDIIRSHILNRLNGPTLASAAAATSQLRRLCIEPHLWRNICAATWPSLSDPLAAPLIPTFPAAHRSLFSDAFPSLHHHPSNLPPSSPPPEELISAVDLYYNGKPIFSRAIRTETHKGWFLCSPLWIDLLDPNELIPTPLASPHSDPAQPEWLHHLEATLGLSWIIIDPAGKRAANVSSRSPVTVLRHWLTGEVEAVFAVAMESVQWVIKVTYCGKSGGAMHVREVSLAMEDADGRHVIGRDSLVILRGAMESGKREKVGVAEAKARYEKFCCVKRERKENRMRREKVMDMVAMLVAFTVFTLLFWCMTFCS